MKPSKIPPPPTAPVPVVPNELEAAAVWVPIGQLKPWDQNPRKNDAAVDQVAESIKRFGFGAPILARRANGELVAGHTRYKAAKKLGLEKVPVRFLDLDPADAHLLALADNKLGEIAEWDEQQLVKVLADLKSEGMDLALSGFTEGEMKKLMAGLATEQIGNDPGAEEPPAIAQSKKGELYELGRCIKCPCCGDLIDV